MSDYNEKLKDPRWQKKRLLVLERDGWFCQACGAEDKTLEVHHLHYFGNVEPWEYPDDFLITLCGECHTREYENLRNAERRMIVALKRNGFKACQFDWFAQVFEHFARATKKEAGLSGPLYLAVTLDPQDVSAALLEYLDNPQRKYPSLYEFCELRRSRGNG